MAGDNLTQGNDSAIARWDGLRRASSVDPGYTVGDSDRRTRFVNGLRELADFLQSRPEIPVPDTDQAVMAFADGTTAEKFAQVDYAGRLLDVPVTDDTARGGHLHAERRFGQVSYEFIATGVGAAFTVGQDVRLTADQAREAESEGLALAGTVTGLRQEADGTYSYTVHFPGHHGTREGMTEDQLEETKSPAIRLRDGSVLSIKDAEETLIEDCARVSIDPGSQVPGRTGQLLKGLSDACGLEFYRLYDQVQPKIDQRIQDLQARNRVTPAAIAARDLVPGPVPLQAPSTGQAAVPPSAARPASRPRP